jgi:hypothetical protein
MKTIRNWLPQQFLEVCARAMAATGRGYRKGSMRRTGKPIFDWRIYPKLTGYDRREDKMDHAVGGRFERNAFRSYRKGYGL